MYTSTSMFPDPILYQRYDPIPSHSCNVEAFPIPYLGALERVVHVVGGWSSDTAVPARVRAHLGICHLALALIIVSRTYKCHY